MRDGPPVARAGRYWAAPSTSDTGQNRLSGRSRGLHPNARPSAPSRAPRVVTVAVHGRKAQRTSKNTRRIALLHAVIGDIVSRPEWSPVDVVVFPGGFFFSDCYIGHLSQIGRARAIRRTAFGRACRAAARRLQRHSAGAVLVVGIDSVGRARDDSGDHLCVAFSPDGVIGGGRKVFPVDADSNGVTKPPVVAYAADFSTPARLIHLANGSRAMLCACYDMFGLAERVSNPTARTAYIRDIVHDGRRVAIEDRGFRQLRTACLAAWRDLLREAQPDLAIAAVHEFRRPGGDLFWQRHGIASASAALEGGLAIGAAHFASRLPAPNGSVLAASGVARRHLSRGQRRTAHPLVPAASFRVSTSAGAALVRLFAPTSPQQR